MEQKSNLGWIIAGVLAVIVVILLGVMWQAMEANKKDLNHVLSEGYEDIATVRAKMQIACDGPSKDEAKCEAALNELADILREFGEDLSTASTSASTTPR
jgi:hypothetical protein